MKKIVLAGVLLAILFIGMSARLVYLQQFYNISMRQADIETRLLTECKFTLNTGHCMLLLEKQNNIVKEWADFNNFWHRGK